MIQVQTMYSAKWPVWAVTWLVTSNIPEILTQANPFNQFFLVLGAWFFAYWSLT